MVIAGESGSRPPRRFFAPSPSVDGASVRAFASAGLPSRTLGQRLGGPLRALVIAAEPDLREALLWAPCSISHADSTDSAAIYAATTLDLVIVDSARFTREQWAALRVSVGLQHVPVLLVVPASSSDLAEGFDAVDTLERPLDRKQVARRARNVAELGRLRRTVDVAEIALNTVPAGITIADATRPELPLAYASAGFERLTGYGAEETLGRNCSFLQGQKTDPKAVMKLRQTLALGHAADIELLNYRKSGETFRNVLSLRPVRDPAGRLRYYVGIQAAKPIPTPEVEGPKPSGIHSLFDTTILDELPAGVIMADEHQRVTFMNRTGARALEREQGGVLGLPLGEALRLPPEVTLTIDDRPQRYTYTLRARDGRDVEIGVTLTPTRGLHPEIRWFALFRDLTSNRETELTARRVERLAAMGTMVSGFAHEVRNPVAAMRLMLEILDEDTPAPDPRRVTLAKLFRHLERIERLVKTSLKFGRPQQPRKTRCIPGKIAEEAIEQVRPRTRELGEIRLIVKPDLPEIEVDGEQMAQALVTLLNNALDVVHGADQIIVRVDHYTAGGGERGLRFEVQDFGTGIADHIAGRIFDPFFTTKPGGTGLGLSIAQRLVHDNGGRLEMRSTPGVGSSFTISLPQLGGLSR